MRIRAALPDEVSSSGLKGNASGGSAWSFFGLWFGSHPEQPLFRRSEEPALSGSAKGTPRRIYGRSLTRPKYAAFRDDDSYENNFKLIHSPNPGSGHTPNPSPLGEYLPTPLE